MNRILVVVLTAAIGLGTFCLPIEAALAQDAAEGTQAAPGSTAPDQAAAGDVQAAAGQQLQEVVVTAERRAVGLQSTPIAITAIQGDQLQTLHLNALADLQTMVPAFTDNSEGATGEFATLNIRGIGSATVGGNSTAGVAVFRDGLEFPETLGQMTPLYDIADTEVLEGPQGTLVGANSTAGAIEINTANPNFRGVSGYVLGGLATYSDIHLQGAVNLPVTDTFAARIAFDHVKRNSFYYDLGATDGGYYFSSYSSTAPQTDGPPLPLNQGNPGVAKPIIDPGHDNHDGVRLSLLWKPSDSFQAVGKVDYFYEETGGEPGEPNPLTFNTAWGAGRGPTYAGCTTQAGTTFTGNQLVCPGAGVTTHSSYYYPGETPRVLDYYGTDWQWSELVMYESLDLRYTLPDGIVLRSLSGTYKNFAISNGTVSNGPQDTGAYPNEGGPTDDTYSEELDVISPTGGKFNWIVGGYDQYRHTPVELSEFLTSPPYAPGELPIEDFIWQFHNSVFRVQALFGQLNWNLTHTLQLQIGARENWDSNFSNNQTNVAPAPGTTLTAPNGTGTYKLNYNCTTGTPPTCSVASYTVLSQQYLNGQPSFSESVPTGKVGLTWNPAPGQNFYLFYARGYKNGGLNPGSTDHSNYNPEHVNDFELGWKGSVLHGHMLTQVGGYYYTYQNMQMTLYDTEALNDTTTGSYTANLGTSKLYGLEVSEQSRFAGLGVDLGLAFSHSELGAASTIASEALPPGWGSPSPLPQCVAGHKYAAGTACFDYTPYTIHLSGEQNPYAPKFTGNINVDYQIHAGHGIIDPRVTFSYTGKQYFDIFEIPYNEMGARHLVNASVDWIDGPWDLQLYGTNLGNQTYIIGAGTGTSSSVYYGAPRQLGFQVTRQF